MTLKCTSPILMESPGEWFLVPGLEKATNSAPVVYSDLLRDGDENVNAMW